MKSKFTFLKCYKDFLITYQCSFNSSFAHVTSWTVVILLLVMQKEKNKSFNKNNVLIYQVLRYDVLPSQPKLDIHCR